MNDAISLDDRGSSWSINRGLSLSTAAGIEQGLIRGWLVDREAAQLEPSIRALMETRFCTGFADVRVHTGPVAAALCVKLQARAFTLGSDIFFGRGQYETASMPGRRLLAHELVHVMQQRSTARATGSVFIPVGNSEDDFEKEADRLAEQALAVGRRDAVTPDGTGTIRRAMKVDFGSAYIEGRHSGTVDQDEDVRPSADIGKGGKEAVFHLNRNAEHLIARHFTDDDLQDDSNIGAVYFQGNVDVYLGPRDDLSKLGFHFIQLAKIHLDRFVYAGCKPSEGAIVQNFAYAPAFPAKFALKFNLDSNATTMDGTAKLLPFTGLRAPTIYPAYSRARAIPGAKHVAVEMYDHPARWVPLRIKNPKTKVDNFLVRGARIFEALTVFVVLDESRKIHQLAHVSWSVSWDATFRWRGGNVQPPSMVPGSSYFRMGKSIKGPPPEKSLEKMIEDSQTIDIAETGNRLERQAIDQVTSSQSNSLINLSVLDRWSSEVPVNFCTGL
jgi:hypothetical protein